MEKILASIKGLWAKANKKLVIVVASIVLVVVAAGVGLGIYLNTPSVLAVRAASRFADDLVARDEFKTITKTLKKGSVEASMSSLKMDDEDLLPEGFAASGKVYFSKNAYMLENLNVKADEFKISGNVYISDKLVYIQEDEILKDAYGIEFDNLAEDFSNSIFAYGSGSDFAIPDEELYDALITTLENSNDDKMVKEFEKIVKKYVKDLYKIVCEHAEFESESDKVKIDGKKQSVRVVTLKIDEKAMANIVNDVYEYLAEDDKLVEFLEKYEDAFAIVVYSANMDKTIAEMYEEMIEEMGEEIDDICDDIESNEFNVEVELVTPKASSKILQLNVSLDDDEMISLDVGKSGIKKSNKITISSGGVDVVYEIEENSKNAYEATLKVGKEKVASIKIDRSGDEFSVSLGASEDNRVVVKGSISKSGKTTTIGVEKIEYTHEDYVYDDDGYWSGHYETVTETIKTNLEIIITESDKIPKAPTDFTTIDQIKEDDIENWVKRVYGEEE